MNLPARRDESGATAVEFALVLTLVVSLFGMLLLLGLRLVYAGLADHAAQVALRTAAVRTHSGYPSDRQVKAAVDDLYPNGLIVDPMTVAVTPSSQSVRSVSNTHQGETVTVTVTYDVPALTAVVSLANVIGVPGLGDLSVITRTATGRFE